MIAHQSWRMLEDALTAFDQADVDLSRRTMGMQYQIEVTYSKVYEDLMAADEADTRPVRDIFALLGIMVGVGRVGDQAKNICEETVFTVTGETKEPKVFRILFVDRKNDCLSQLAEAYARKAFPNSGVYASGGWEEPGTLDPALLAFMDEQNLDVRRVAPERVRPVIRELADYHVIVSLEGDIDEAIPRRPYRTVMLEWDVPGCPDDPETDEGRARLLDCYRELTVRIRNLMEDLRGPGAD
jgi:phosphate transport system protein